MIFVIHAQPLTGTKKALSRRNEMKKQSQDERFLRLTPAERAGEIARFDREFDESEFHELDVQSKRIWQRAKRKRAAKDN
jgi:hypothetical protein